MDNHRKYKFFLLIGLDEIKFTALNESNKILLEKQLTVNDFSLDENFKTLDEFLNQNIFNLEKTLSSYVDEINLLINYDDFISVDVSTTHNFNNNSNHLNKIPNFLVNLKDNVIKNMNGYNLIHMVINQFIIDGKEYSSIQKNADYNNIFLEVKFICLKSKILQNLKKIFSKYEISVKNVSFYKYVYNFKKSKDNNIFILAEKLNNGFNQKEIFIVDKPSKNQGFFERFFNLFN
tara:strand:+ start:1233 stop:1934 length:702 start_codon:yes stop_codon:yes gene_type:complete